MKRVAARDDLPAPVESSASPAGGGVLGWLMAEGRLIAETAEFIDAYCTRLIQSGLPLVRSTLHTRTLHPQVRATIWLWRRGLGGTQTDAEHGIETTAAYLRSPLRPLYEDGAAMMRRRLVGPDAQIDFPVLEEVRATGATDYLALPLCSVEGVTSAVTYATDRPEGFISAEVSMLESLSPALAMAIEIQAKRRILTTLLDIYLGHDAGLRVLAGTIRRGDMQRIYAVLWYCDLRGFTRLSEKLPPDELIETLNAFFECMGGAVEAESGDILKFIGDGMLAIFPVGEFEYCDNVATRAYRAAEDALRRLDALNTERRRAGQPSLKCGIVLHVGDVIFGNIGAPRRLDFTVIGPAVNLAARIEALCAELGRRLLVSATFARFARAPLVSLGAYPLKGLTEPQEVFAPAEGGG
jgi:adenylate cyclase